MPLAPGAGTVEPVAEEATGGFWAGLRDLAATDGFLELVLVGLCAAALLWVWFSMMRLSRTARERVAVRDYLLGVEQALAGDLKGARKRLDKVLTEDPENHYARLLFGKVLAAMGEPAEAHKHHLVLQRSFGVVSRKNDLQLARALLAAGRPAEATDATERAARAHPRDPETLQLLFKAQLAAGRAEEAGRTGQKLLPLLVDAEDRHHVRDQAAAALARAGMERLAKHQPEGVEGLLADATMLVADAPQVRLLRARVEAERLGAEAAVRALLHELENLQPASESALLGSIGEPVALPMLDADALGNSGRSVGAAMVPVASSTSQAGASTAVTIGSSGAVGAAAQTLQVLGRLLPATRFQCGACGAALRAPRIPCAACGAQDHAIALEPALYDELGGPTLVMDEIDQNRTYIRRLVERLLDEDGDEDGDGSDLEIEVAQLDEAAIPDLLDAALRANAPGRARVVAVLRGMGPKIAPALFAAVDAAGQSSGGLSGLAKSGLQKAGVTRSPRSLTSVVGEVVQGFGREALPWFEGVLDTADREQRKILIDYFIGLGDPRELPMILDRFPLVEVIHRLNRAPSDTLQGLFSRAEPQSFLVDGILLDAAFAREEDVLLAVPAATSPETLLTVLKQRGSSRSLAEQLIASCADPVLGPTSVELLGAYGMEVLDPMLIAFTDLDKSDEVRSVLADRLAALGGAVVERVVGCFGPSASGLDASLHDVLVAIRDEAAKPLADAYEKEGLLEKFGAGLVSRHTHRRVQIVKALASIGSDVPEAEAVLRRLRRQERDNNLKLRIAQALHGLEAEVQGRDSLRKEDHGQAG